MIYNIHSTGLAQCMQHGAEFILHSIIPFLIPVNLYPLECSFSISEKGTGTATFFHGKFWVSLGVYFRC